MFGVVLLGALSVVTVLAQRPTPTPKPPDPGLVRWKIFLDTLEQQSRSIAEERKPYVVADVAVTYWEVDKGESQRLFITAIDAALKLAERDKKYYNLVNHVLSTASKLDVSLAKLLTKRIVDKQESKKSRYDIAGSNLYELLKEDPQRAAELAEAFAPDGLPLAAPNFIFNLAKVDVGLANRVYGVYLERLSAREDISVEHSVSMSGYAFGYSEYFTMDGTGGTSGAMLLPVPGLEANPRYAAAMLNLMFRRINREIEERNNAVGADIEQRTWRLLFAAEYLGPQVAIFAPSMTSGWEQLRQQVRVGASAEQLQAVGMRVNSIFQDRIRVRSISDSTDKFDEMAEAGLDGVEKIVGTCQRDLVYMKAALHFSYRKNFKRSLELLSKVEGEERAESVRLTVFYDMTMADIEKAEWEPAEERVKRISSPQMKTLAQIKLADGLIKKGEKSEARRVAGDAIKMIEKLSDAKDRAGTYFGLAAILMRIDANEARSELERALKHFNKLEPKDEYRYSHLVQVLMNCEAKADGPWYGGSYTLENSNVFDIVKLLAKENADATKLVAESISDTPTRIRAEAIITRMAFAKLQKTPTSTN
jgi:hypothetical protein